MIRPALRDDDFLGAIATRFRRQRNADGIANAFLKQNRQRSGRGNDPL